MTGQIVRFLKGYVRIRINSREPERFLNLCAKNNLFLYHIKELGGCCELDISLADFFKLRPICRKTHTRIHILQKKGIPFFFLKNRKRKAFFAGLAMCFVLLYLLSLRIWNIHVEGNYSYSTQSILAYLEEQDICHGIAKKKLSCADIAAGIRENFPEMIWVSAKIQGTRLLILVQENMDSLPLPNSEEDLSPSDLVATKEGTIIRMVTRQGIPQAQVGDSCEKGQILIRGVVDITNDNGDVVRQDLVPADGDVYIRTVYSYYKEFPLMYDKRVYTGKTRENFVLQLHSLEIQAGLPGRDFGRYDRVGRFHTLKLTENFYLPVVFGKNTSYEYRIIRKKYTPEEAQELAKGYILRFLDEIMEKGVEILENGVKIEITENRCISKGRVYGLEKNGDLVPLTEHRETPMAENTDEQQ